MMSKFDKLSDVAEVIDSLHKTPKYSDEGQAMVRCTDVKYGKLDLKSTFKVNEEVFKEFSRRYKPSKDDIIITRVGSYGITAIVDELDFCLGQNTSVIVPKNINARYLYLALNSPNVKNQIEFSVVGSTQKTLSLKAINNLEIPRFEPYIEDKIAKIGGELDDKIELNTQTNQTLEQIAQAIFKSWFVDFEPVNAKIETLAAGGSAGDAELAAMSVISAKTIDELNNLKASNSEAFNKLAQTASLFPAAMQDSELGEIPDGWNKGTIEDVVQFSSERVDASGLNLKNYISTENMLENKRGITTASSLPSVNSVPAFKENEILISNIRPYFKKIWLTEFKGGRSPDVLGFSLLDPEETEFAYNLLYQDRFFEYMMTTSKGAKMPRGDKSAIKQFSFPLPQKELRLVFSNQVRPFYPMIRNTNKESEHLHALRDALLPELLSGNLGRA